MRRQRAVLALLWLAAGSGFAENPGEKRQVYTLRVPFWVQETRDEKAPVVGPRAITTEVRGRKIANDFLLGPNSDLFLLVGLDFTGDSATAADAKDALSVEIQKLGPQTYVSVLNCQDELRVVQEPTRNREQSLQAIQSVAAIGKPGLLNCVERVESIADAMLQHSAVRVGVLFLSDADVQNLSAGSVSGAACTQRHS